MMKAAGGDDAALRVAVADDDESVRLMLRAWLSSDARFSCAGEAEDGDTVRSLIDRTAPDALILDLSMPAEHGLTVLDDLRTRGCEIPVVVFSAAAGAGVSDTVHAYPNASFVSKGASLDELADALERYRPVEVAPGPAWSARAEAAAGIALLLAALAAAVRLGSPLGHPALGIGFTAAMAATYALPVRRLARSGHTSVTLDGHVLVALSMLLPPSGAMVAVAVGGAAGLGLSRPRRSGSRIAYTTGVFAVMAVFESWAVHRLAGAGASGWWTATVAAGAYVVALGASLGLMTVILQLRQGVPAGSLLRRHLPTAAALAAGVAVPVGVAVGLLGASRPGALAFLAVPQFVLLVGVRHGSRNRRERDALRAVVEVGHHAQLAGSPSAVDQQLLALARRLVDTDVVLVDAPPGPGTTAVSLDGVAGPWLVASELSDDEAAIFALVGAVGAPARENARLRANELRDARHDPLTGLANPRLLREALEQSLRSFRASGTPVSLLYLDLDGFKDVNDTFGHGAGDHVLREVARRLQSHVRPFDLVARAGGDEFVVIVSGVGDHETLERVASDLRAAIAAPIDLRDLRVTVGASIGMARCPADTAEPETLVRIADERMFADKRRRKAPAET